MSIPHPHDLLRIMLPHSAIPHDAPAWVRDSLAEAPWVVVRRAPPQSGHHPVGVRGSARTHRYAMTVPCATVVEVTTPEQLSRSDLTAARREPAIDALRELWPLLTSTGLRWGPTGAVGYELATGRPVVHPDSDLDLAIYVDGTAQPDFAALAQLLRGTRTRVDCLIEYPWGAITLNEVATGAAEVLVRSPDGPRLVRTEDLP